MGSFSVALMWKKAKQRQLQNQHLELQMSEIRNGFHGICCKLQSG